MSKGIFGCLNYKEIKMGLPWKRSRKANDSNDDDDMDNDELSVSQIFRISVTLVFDCCFVKISH